MGDIPEDIGGIPQPQSDRNQTPGNEAKPQQETSNKEEQSLAIVRLVLQGFNEAARYFRSEAIKLKDQIEGIREKGDLATALNYNQQAQLEEGLAAKLQLFARELSDAAHRKGTYEAITQQSLFKQELLEQSAGDAAFHFTNAVILKFGQDAVWAKAYCTSQLRKDLAPKPVQEKAKSTKSISQRFREEVYNRLSPERKKKIDKLEKTITKGNFERYQKMFIDMHDRALTSGEPKEFTPLPQDKGKTIEQIFKEHIYDRLSPEKQEKVEVVKKELSPEQFIAFQKNMLNLRQGVVNAKIKANQLKQKAQAIKEAAEKDQDKPPL